MTKRKLISALLPAMMLGMSSGAQALVLNSSADVSADGFGASDSNSAASGYVSAYANEYGPSSDAYARSSVGDSGQMGVGGSGQGLSYSGAAQVSWADTFTNTSSADLGVNFDFEILGGYLDTYGVDTAGESAESSYWIDILVNGASAWSSSATLSSLATGSSLLETGTSLGGSLFHYSDGGEYYWNDSTLSLDLGLLGAGEAISVEYRMGSSFAGVGVFDGSGSAMLPTCIDGSAECLASWADYLRSIDSWVLDEFRLDAGCSMEPDAACTEQWVRALPMLPMFADGGDGFDGCYDEVCSPGGVDSGVWIGDPFGFNPGAANPTFATYSVPTPQVLLMLGAGLVLLSALRRKS